MRFGIFDHLERRTDVSLAQQYEERMQLLQLAEEAGIYGYHVAEHHHGPLCMAPNQNVYLASAAQRTTTLRIGPLVQVLPLYHPIRVIEEICMLDQLSNGRYQIGVGPGTGGGTEYALWGGDREENYPLFEETLEIVRRGLQEQYLDYEGQFYYLKHLWMEMRPVQEPHPPFWWAGRAESAAARGANYVSGAPVHALPDAMATYRKALEETVRNPAPYVVPTSDPLYGSMTRLFIADTDDEARERALSAYRVYCDNFAFEGRFTSTEERERLVGNWQASRSGEEAPATVAAAMMDAERALEVGIVRAGSPETLRQYAMQYRESGANYFVASFQWGDLTHEEASRSMRLFAQEVMPVFD